MNNPAKKYLEHDVKETVNRAIKNPVIYEHDISYKRLLGLTEWQRLRPEIRRRFSIKPSKNCDIEYEGVMEKVELSFFGWLFTQACRFIGTPIATRTGRNIPVAVKLSGDDKHNGIAWHRTYRFSGHPYTVVSTKSINGEGELEEHIGRGFFMKLHVFQQDGDLHFVSTSYCLRLGKALIRLPDLITPGKTTVVHKQIAGALFRFTLSVDHPVLGKTIYQTGEFRDKRDCP